jgi:hypothetical protein
MKVWKLLLVYIFKRNLHSLIVFTFFRLLNCCVSIAHLQSVIKVSHNSIYSYAKRYINYIHIN